MNKNSILRFSIAILMTGTLCFLYAQQTPAKLDTVKVKDDLYVIHNDVVPVKITVLITTEGVLLVYDKFEVDSPNVVVAVKNLMNQPIKYIVNTHHHADHSGGNAR